MKKGKRDFKKEREHKRMRALGRTTCPACNDGTALIPLPEGISIPVSMGQGEKAKTVWVADRDVPTDVMCCTKCEWHTTAPAGNVEWTKFTSREREKEQSYERHMSELKQAAWRTSGEARIESAYAAWVSLGTKVDADLIEMKQAISGQLVRRLCREFYKEKDLVDIFEPSRYSRKAVDKVIRALIYKDHDNNEWMSQYEAARAIDARLPTHKEIGGDVFAQLADGTTEFRREARSVVFSWVHDLLDSPSVIREALARNEPLMIKDVLGEGHQSFIGDDSISIRFVVRLMSKYQGQPKVRAARREAEAAWYGFPPCHLLESKAAVKACSDRLAEWDAATSRLAERFYEGKKIVLKELPQAMQRFFCIETVGWDEVTFQAYADTSWLYQDAPEFRGPLKDAAALASLIERYTNSGLSWIKLLVRQKAELAYGFNDQRLAE